MSVPAAPAPPSSSAGARRILFMDDEEMLQELVGAMLEHLGYEVECAAHGEEAVARYAQAHHGGRPFAAAILDLTVPGRMGGFETLQQLRALDPQVKAIVSSGYPGDPIMTQYASHGFAGVIAKPYQLEDLARVMHDVIAGESKPA